MSHGSINLRGAYRFFLPLFFMTELNQITKTVIHAVLARTALPSITLAAFNTAFVFYYTLASATELAVPLTISYLKDRRAVRRLLAFMTLVLAGPFAVAQLVAWTPIGNWVYGVLFGLGESAVAQARLATFILSLTMPVLVLRGGAFGLLMLNKRTTLITLCTFVRLCSLGVSLLTLPLFLYDAALGAGALTVCISTESLFAVFMARPYYRALPESGAEPPPKRALWTFAWPLILNQSSELGVVFVINLFLGRLINPELALAAFGVVHGLVSFLLSPLRNLAQTAQTLTGNRADMRVMIGFSLQLVVFFAALTALLFFTPLSSLVLDDLMGLRGELRDYCVPATRIAFLMALFWALSALFRGMLAGARTTGTLALTGALRLFSAALIGVVTVLYGNVNGAVVGLTAWIVSYVVESVVLGWRLKSVNLRDETDAAA